MNERQYQRISLKLPVEYSAGSSKSRGTGYVSNLSPGGVMLSIRERLNVHQQVELAIFASMGTNMEAIKVHSKIVWADDTAQEGMFIFGAKFVDQAVAEKAKLTRVFEELSANQALQGIAAKHAYRTHVEYPWEKRNQDTQRVDICCGQ